MGKIIKNGKVVSTIKKAEKKAEKKEGIDLPLNCPFNEIKSAFLDGDPYLSGKYNRDEKILREDKYIQNYLPEIKDGCKNILSIGCGTFEFGELCQYYGNRVTGIDTNIKLMGNYSALSKHLHKIQGLDVNYDGFDNMLHSGKVPYDDNSFDIIESKGALSLIFFNYMDGKEEYMESFRTKELSWLFTYHLTVVFRHMCSEIRRMLKPNGYFLLWDNENKNQFIFNGWASSIFKDYFKVELIHDKIFKLTKEEKKFHINTGAKKKILMVPDVMGWIWYTKSLSIQRHLKNRYDIDIKVYKKFNEEEDVKKYDSVFVWPHYGVYKDPSKLLSAVCSHAFENRLDTSNLSKFKALSCVSPKIYDALEKKGYNKNLFLTMNGVEENIFYPNNFPKDDGVFKVLVVSKKGLYYDPRFSSTIIDKLKPYGKLIQITNHNSNYKDCTPWRQMPAIYNTHHLFIAVNELEGTPNPLFEAAACGLPCISRDVGCASELLPSEFIINDPNTFADKIIELFRDRNKCREASERNRSEIMKKWTWEQRAQYFVPFFES